MKKIALFLLASITVAVATQATAQAGGLTRAEVKQQLVQAEAKGLAPSSSVDYPPSQRSIARNRAIFEARHEGKIGSFAQTTGMPARPKRTGRIERGEGRE